MEDTLSVPSRDSTESENNSNESSGNIVVSLVNASKSYGKGPNVLSNFTMSVREGTIYGLLGASGCGKTTVLSCIVGRKRLNSGTISVFNGVPGDRRTGVPGNRIGYMPQELALYGEFTPRETLQYFGRLYEMDSEIVTKQIHFLFDLLSLSNQTQLIRNLSGGQKRRVSFAASLLHNADLYILDEPTVGVDPKLRQNIWDHLLHLTSVLKKTIIITTHYIEEAKQASMTGLMSNGRLLAENSPSDLLRIYELSTLEQVFLKLCLKQDSELSDKGSYERPSAIKRFLNLLRSKSNLRRKKNSLNGTELNQNQISLPAIQLVKTITTTDETVSENVLSTSSSMIKSSSSEPLSSSSSTSSLSSGSTGSSESTGSSSSYKYNYFSRSKLRALMMKNFIRMSRNIINLFFIFLLPALEVVLFCVAIGKDPSNLTLGFYNNEISFNESCTYSSSCDSYTNLSCLYLKYLRNESSLDIKDYESLDVAKSDLSNGFIWGVIEVPQNFSINYVVRLRSGSFATIDILNQSSLHTTLDMSNQQVSLTLQSSIIHAYQEFIDNILDTCSSPKELGRLPIVFHDPIYGSKNNNFTVFMAPGLIILVIYFLAIASTGEAFISEHRDGLLERSWVAGVTPLEFIVSTISTQFIVMLIQTFVTLIFIFVVFQIPCDGPFIWLLIIALLQGIAGMCFGFLVSTICSEESTAMQLSISSFYPTLLLSGILWPLEGMPFHLQKFSWILPSTAACQGMRDVMSRGWSIAYPSIYIAILVTSAWIVFFLIASWIFIKLKK